jgi:hypothetical protein
MSSLDERIRAVVDAAIVKERARSEAVLAEVVAELQRRFNQRFERADGLLDTLNGDVRELYGNKPDRHGVIRKQFFTPQPRG